MMKVLCGMALRQTTGFVESLLRLIGPDWEVPDFGTLSRCRKFLKVNVPYRGVQGRLRLLTDSSGIRVKVEGEGEWNARKHGGPRRRVWRKIHPGIDEETLEIRAAEVTGSDVGDAPMLPELAAQISADQDIAGVTADGASDTRKRPDAIAERGSAAVIPPRKNASCETVGSASHGAGLQPPGRGVQGPCRRAEGLHRAGNPRHECRRIALSGDGCRPAVGQFVQQSPTEPGFGATVDDAKSRTPEGRNCLKREIERKPDAFGPGEAKHRPVGRGTGEAACLTQGDCHHARGWCGVGPGLGRQRDTPSAGAAIADKCPQRTSVP